MKKNKQISIIPVSEDSLYEWMNELVLEKIGTVIEIINGLGKNYLHETPWNSKYIDDAKYYLYRASIGAVGRINKVDDAVVLGLLSDCRAPSRCFTSTALYKVFCIARNMKKQIKHVQDLEKWINNYTFDRTPNSRFVEYEKYAGH